MRAMELQFLPDGMVRGAGTDMVGWFTMVGAWDRQTGRIHLVKKYLGQHEVIYVGEPDGEGCICGTWTIGAEQSGPFRLWPVIRRPPSDTPIQDLSET